jgi:glycosyltransferase involved in cell wall biosynthesis
MSLQVSIYTIALNEIQFVERWVNAHKDHATLVVADTGSTDGTPQALRDLGVQVHDIHVKPWRFDDARNTALALTPADSQVCISVDMDELMAPGWYEALCKSWTPQTTRLRYTYVWSFDAHDKPRHSFMGDKCHARHHYRWRRPVHETVFHTGGNPELITTAPEVCMWHKQDACKSRSQYLPLLELSHAENPACSQTLFWLAREYAYQNQSESAVSHFRKYLEMPHATWHEERAECHRWLSKLLPHDKLHHLRMATAIAPMKREPWMDLADHYYHETNWPQCYSHALQGLQIAHKSNTYLDSVEAWGYKLPDLAGIAAYNLGLYHEAVKWFTQAVDVSPQDVRLQNNLKHALRKQQGG